MAISLWPLFYKQCDNSKMLNMVSGAMTYENCNFECKIKYKPNKTILYSKLNLNLLNIKPVVSLHLDIFPSWAKELA